MKNLRNNVQLIGHVGQTPEVVTFESGAKMVKVRMATNESYKNSTGTVIKDTQWHNVIAWGKQAELVSDLVEKGQEIAIDGKLVSRTYETKDEEKRRITEIHLNSFQLLGNRQAQEA